MNQHLTIGILTHNSGRTLRRALESVRGFSVVIADGSSTDDTLAIAKEFGARIIPQPRAALDKEGRIVDFAAARQSTLDAAEEGWFFYLDSDEIVSPALREKMAQIVSAPLEEPLVYRVRYAKVPPSLAHEWRTWRPYYQTRFFHTRSGAHFTKPIHERIEFPAQKVGTLEEPWYVVLEKKDLDFSEFKRIVTFRITRTAENWHPKSALDVLSFLFLSRLPSALKSVFKLIAVPLRHGRKGIPWRYERNRLYAEWVETKAYIKRYFSNYVQH